MPPQNAWIIRPYPKKDCLFDEFKARKIAGIGWPAVRDMTGIEEEELEQRLLKAFPKQPALWHTKSKATLLRFRDDVQMGDLVVIAPMVSDSDRVAIGEVTSDYTFMPEFTQEGYPHQRGLRFLSILLMRKRLTGVVRFSALEAVLPADVEKLTKFCIDAGMKVSS